LNLSPFFGKLNGNGGKPPKNVRDILKAGGKTELDNAAIENELEGVALAETVFGGLLTSA